MSYNYATSTTKKSSDRYTIIKMFILLSSLTVAMLTKNTWIAFFSIMLLILVDKRFIIPSILITPLIKNILLAKEGVTITKIVIIFTVIMLFFEMLMHGKIILDRKMHCVIIYLVIVFCGLLNSIYFSDNLFVLWNYKEVISENFIAFIPQILFVIFLYNFLVKMNFNFLKESFEISKWLISIFLIIVSMYFLTIGGVKSNWWNVATRLTLQGTDPNEFSAMLIALSIFPQYMMFEGNNKTQIFIGMLSSITTFYAAFKTLSKGGFLTLIFAFVFCIIIFSRRNKFKVISIVLVLASLVLLFSYNGIFNFQPMRERFFGEHINNISDLTTGRFDYWKLAFNAFKDKPFFGYGGSSLTSRWLTFQFYGKQAVLHNLYLEILVNYGIIGLLSFLSIIYFILKDFLSMNKKKDDASIFLIPFISLASLLFAGLGLTWLWKELMWFFIGICLSTGTIVLEKYKYS